MKIGDYILQSWRMQVARHWIPSGSRVLDIGCHQGEFLKMLGHSIAPSVGLDPLYEGNPESNRHQFFSLGFHEGLVFEDGSFDVIVLLATLEHIQEKAPIAREAKRLLKTGGLVVITIPSLFVDKILSILLFLGIIDGMSLDEHHSFSPDDLPNIFISEGFRLKNRRKFQFGLNHLFVFERT